MRIMISQPMAGEKVAEIKAIRKKLIEKFKEMHIEVVDSFITDEAPDDIYKPNVYYLGRTIMNYLCNVDAVFFVDGWEKARGCRIEHEICKEYGIKCLYEDFLHTELNYLPKPRFCSTDVKPVKFEDMPIHNAPLPDFSVSIPNPFINNTK